MATDNDTGPTSGIPEVGPVCHVPPRTDDQRPAATPVYGPDEQSRPDPEEELERFLAEVRQRAMSSQFVPWIAEPGVYPDVTDEQYRRDPVIGGSVTSSTLRKMTPPKGTPAHAWHYLHAKREDKGYFDLGGAFHARLLGTGGEIVRVEVDNWKSKPAQERRKEIREAGGIPVHNGEAAIVEAMYAAVMAHPDAAAFFTPGGFVAELTIVWRDPATGVMCRGRIDAVPHYTDELIELDVKTTARHADPASVSTSLADYGYHQQHAFYISGLWALISLGKLEPVDRITPYVVAVGKEPPHVPLCRPIDEESIRIGDVCNRKALDLYATCKETGQWPGYDDPDGERQPIGLPRWARYQFDAAYAAGMYDVDQMGDLW